MSNQNMLLVQRAMFINFLKFSPKKVDSGTKFFSWPFCTWNIAPILLAKMWQQQLCGGRVCLKFMAVALCKFL